MNWIIENWYILIGLIALLMSIGLITYKFAGLPTKEQVKKIKALLLYWVTLAEKELGSGTGQIKLRYVYDLFTEKFNVAARLVSFELFSIWVDEALEQMRTMLVNNEKVHELIKG
jgi:hypothetical protein